MTTTSTQLNLIIGNPIAHSQSPSIHSQLYSKFNLDSKFVFLASNIKSTELGQLMQSIKVLPINSLSVAIPHKVEIIEYLDDVDSIAMQIGAVNTVVTIGKILKGYNTDWLGVLMPLAIEMGIKIDPKLTNLPKIPKFLKEHTVAIIGSGGVARAAAYAVLCSGADVLIFNKTVDKAERLAQDMLEIFPNQNIHFFGHKYIGKTNYADIIINCTSTGLDIEEKVEGIEFRSEQLLFDLVYKPKYTELVKQAQDKGCRIILGEEMFLWQTLYQFQLQTGIKIDIQDVRGILG